MAGFFVALSVVLALVFVCALGCIICCGVYLQRKEVPDDWDWFDRSYVMENASSGQTAAEIEADSANARRQLVLNSINLKKVIMGSNRNNDENNRSNIESSVRDVLAKSVKNFRTWVGNESSSQGKSPPDSIEVFQGDDEGKSERKSDIIIENIKYRKSLSQMKTSFRNRLSSRGSSASSMELYTTKTCFICLERYKVGESIVWSTNKECCHSYHKDCMVRWLMDHDDCPLCRKDYLNIRPVMK